MGTIVQANTDNDKVHCKILSNRQKRTRKRQIVSGFLELRLLSATFHFGHSVWSFFHFPFRFFLPLTPQIGSNYTACYNWILACTVFIWHFLGYQQEMIKLEDRRSQVERNLYRWLWKANINKCKFNHDLRKPKVKGRERQMGEREREGESLSQRDLALRPLQV